MDLNVSRPDGRPPPATPAWTRCARTAAGFLQVLGGSAVALGLAACDAAIGPRRTPAGT